MSELKITKRFCTGEYEFDEITLTINDVKRDEIEELIQYSKQQIINGQKEKEEENAKPSSSKNSNKNGKGPSKKASGVDDEGSEDDETSNSKASDDDNDSTENSESEDGDGGEEETKSGKAIGTKEKEKGKKSFKRKPQTYDRSIEQHKEIFSGCLRVINGDWKKSEESKKKAKKASEAIEGEDFLDENGEVLDSFKAKIKKLMR